MKAPALQLVQAAAPAEDWKVPAAQGVHEETLLDVEKKPTAQLTQAALPLN